MDALRYVTVSLALLMFTFVSVAPYALADSIVGGEIGASVNPNGGENCLGNTPPEVPVIVAPENGFATNELEFTLEWTEVTDFENPTVTYKVYIDKENDFIGSEQFAETENTNILTSEFFISNNTHYFWKVASWDGCDLSFSETHEFDVGDPGYVEPTENQTITVPVLSLPINGKEMNETPIIEWLPVESALYYKVRIWRQGYDVNYVERETNDTEYDTGLLNLNNGTYVWKVRAFNDVADSNFSEEWTFAINTTMEESNETVDNVANETNETTDTSYCGDGTCDSEETCSDCAADCGVCPATSSTTTSSSTTTTSGGGGGGGYTGGGGSTTTTNETNNETVENETETIQQEPEDESIIILEENETLENETQLTNQTSNDGVTGLITAMQPYTLYIAAGIGVLVALGAFFTRFKVAWV